MLRQHEGDIPVAEIRMCGHSSVICGDEMGLINDAVEFTRAMETVVETNGSGFPGPLHLGVPSGTPASCSMMRNVQLEPWVTC
jgi:hypothetical protein